MNEQEKFWAGDFGNDYASRNQSRQQLASNLYFWSKIIARTADIKNVLELGANVGMNIKALDLLLPESSFTAVEINKKACDNFVEIENQIALYNFSIREYIFEMTKDDDTEEGVYRRSEDLVFVSGVLIHQNPNDLPMIYDFMAETSDKYVLINEYYSPYPTEVIYRGHSDKLFKRDFGGEFLSRRPEYDILDYGFCSSMDANFPKDNTNWWLLKRVE